MTPTWRAYWAHMAAYLWLWPLGFLLAFIPVLFDAGDAWREGRLPARLFVCASYGVIVPGTIWLVCAGVFAAAAHARRGRPLGASTAQKVLCAGIGMVLGILLAKAFIAAVLGREVAGGLLSSLLFGLVLLFVFSVLFDQQVAKQEALALRAAAAEAGYRALEHQMRPHFLFNALNSLAEMIESEHDGAAGVAHTLSDLYRQILANSRAKTSTLASELEIATRYLEVEKVRFGRRLTFAVDAPDAVASLHVPSLVIQTLVENAVKHGVARSLDGGHVRVEASEAPGGLLLLTVANTGAPFRGDGGTGTGLANTRARLDLLYGDRHGFSIGTDSQGRTIASFRVTGECID